MSTPRSRRLPVTVTHLPVTRCQLCDRTLAYRPGNITEVLTEHHRRAYPEALRIPAPYRSHRPACGVPEVCSFL
jgi:hypothetical protein